MDATILDEIAEAERKQSERASDAKKIKDQIGRTIAMRQEKHSSLRKQSEQKRRLLDDALRAGLDTTPLAKPIADLDAKVSQLAAEIEALRREQEKSANVAPLDFEREKHLAEVLRKYFACEHAAQVDELDSCWASLPTYVSEWDTAGRPTKCTMQLGLSIEKTVALSGNERRFSRRFKPDALKWLPDDAIGESEPDLRARPDRNPGMLAFRSSNGRLILTDTKLSWREEYSKPSQYYGGPEKTDQRPREEDFSDVADSLAVEFGKRVEVGGGSLDLTREFGVPLLDHMRGVVLAATTGEPRFEPCTDELTSPEVFELIKDRWSAFVRAPWSAELKDKLALLKYCLENGERARFWTEEFKNHFGFRLRTRDHDWIKGNIFISAPCKKEMPRIKLYGHGSDHSGWMAEVAGMWIVVYGR
jgi:hypothetical protein